MSLINSSEDTVKEVSLKTLENKLGSIKTRTSLFSSFKEKFDQIYESFDGLLPIWHHKNSLKKNFDYDPNCFFEQNQIDDVLFVEYNQNNHMVVLEIIPNKETIKSFAGKRHKKFYSIAEFHLLYNFELLKNYDYLMPDADGICVCLFPEIGSKNVISAITKYNDTDEDENYFVDEGEFVYVVKKVSIKDDQNNICLYKVLKNGHQFWLQTSLVSLEHPDFFTLNQHIL